MSDEPLVLEGWEKIRAYMSRQGVRRSTVSLQKYTKHHGLPVWKNDATNVVYAAPEDLDRWILRYLIGKD